MDATQSRILSKWEELERLLQENQLDEFYGRTGWVRCEPFECHSASGDWHFWIWIKTPQGTTTVSALPGDTVEDLWVKFLKEIQPLRELGWLQRPVEGRRPVSVAPVSTAVPEGEPLPGGVAHVLQVIATTEGRNGRVLVDPILHRTVPGAAYQERFRLQSEKLGMAGAKVGIRALLVK